MKNEGKKILSGLLSSLAILSGVLSAAPVSGDENGRPAPEITGQTWINTDPLRLADLKGKVVLVEFWAFGCSNCRNVEPHVQEWHKKYADQGLVVIAVHTPETDFERYVKNVEHYVLEQHITYAVVTDNDFATWTRYRNRAWPTVYLIDKQGEIRYLHIGEGAYTQTDEFIRELLTEK